MILASETITQRQLDIVTAFPPLTEAGNDPYTPEAYGISTQPLSVFTQFLADDLRRPEFSRVPTANALKTSLATIVLPTGDGEWPVRSMSGASRDEPGDARGRCGMARLIGVARSQRPDKRPKIRARVRKSAQAGETARGGGDGETKGKVRGTLMVADEECGVSAS